VEKIKDIIDSIDIELKEEDFECINDNPLSHQSCGERQGCIQNCGECDYYQLIEK